MAGPKSVKSREAEGVMLVEPVPQANPKGLFQYLIDPSAMDERAVEARSPSSGERTTAGQPQPTHFVERRRGERRKSGRAAAGAGLVPHPHSYGVVLAAYVASTDAESAARTDPDAVAITRVAEGNRGEAADSKPAISILVASLEPSELEPFMRRLRQETLKSRSHAQTYRLIDASGPPFEGMDCVQPDAILIRVERPDDPIRETVRSLKEKWNVPIIAAFSAQMAAELVDSPIDGLTDFVFEPVRREELIARVGLAIRRHRSVHVAAHVSVDVAGVGDRLGACNLCIDDAHKTVNVRGKAIQLTPKEYRLLRLLASDSERVFSDAEIIDELWPHNNQAGSADVAQYVHRLRKKLENGPCVPRVIVNVKGFGYMLKGACPQGPC